MTFQVGETYTNQNYHQDIFIMALQKVEDGVVLAILWVDRKSKETTGLPADIRVTNEEAESVWRKVA